MHTFIQQLALWLNKFNSDSTFQGISLKVFMSLPALLFQKLLRKNKAKEHGLDRRLKWWIEGGLHLLMHECREIQRRLGKTIPGA